jgi:hypothetical protein
MTSSTYIARYKGGRPGRNSADKDAVFVSHLAETNGFELFRDEMVPVARGTLEAVESLLESPIGIQFQDWTFCWWTDDGRFVFG